MKDNLDRYWIALYSASGREIYEISKRLGRFPDRIITNQKDVSKTIPELLAECEKENIDFIQNINPDIKTYRELFLPGSLVTMHGYLKILPPQICDENFIINCHPGNTIQRICTDTNLYQGYFGVVDQPEPLDIPIIIGKDPQRKALEIRAPYTGVTIHEATAELDSGEILAFKEVRNRFTNTFLTEEVLTEFINELRDISINLWIPVLEKYLTYEDK